MVAAPPAVVVHVEHGRESIRLGGRDLVSWPAWSPNARNGSPGPIMLLGRAGGWVLFAIDPGGSASLTADGVLLQAVSPAGHVRTIATTLAYDDYRVWCGGRLVLVAGGDRIATRNKRLVAARPPDWKPVPLVRGTRMAWGSVACAPSGPRVSRTTYGRMRVPPFAIADTAFTICRGVTVIP